MPDGTREVGADSTAQTIGVLAAEQDPFVVALLLGSENDSHPRPVWLGSHHVTHVSYDPADFASTRVVLRAFDTAGDAQAIELDRDFVVINLGIPTRTDLDLDEVDRSYAAGEWRAAWLAALATAPCQVLNRPSGSMYWLLEAGPMLLRRRLREFGFATVVDRVISATALDRHEREGWHVGASTISRKTQPVESLTRLQGGHYRVLPLRPPLRYSIRAVFLGRVIPLQLSADGARLIQEALQEDDALAPASIEVCRLLELDIGFVTFVEAQSVAQVSMVGMTPPAPLDPSAGAAIAARLLRELASEVRR